MSTSHRPTHRRATTRRATTRRVVGSPIGDLTVVATDDSIVAILFPGDDPARPAVDVEPDDGAHPVLDETERQLGEYFAGERTEFELPLEPSGTDFQQAAWTVLRTIPFGATWSYGEQAAAMGDRNKARAVGAANGRNPIPIVVPCHRVRGADGSLTGFAGGLDAKAWLLDHERAVSSR